MREDLRSYKKQLIRTVRNRQSLWQRWSDDGDVITIDAGKGVVAVVDNDEFASREAHAAVENLQTGMGRELFAAFRERATGAEQGASLFGNVKE